MSQVRVYGKFSKVEQLADGTIHVEGIASTESRDAAGEIIKASAMRKALPDYMKFPTVREMHETWAAGRTLRADVMQDGVTKIAAKIVDEEAVKKVKEGVYNGFSIGGSVLRRSDKDATVIEELELTEISLVDRPANPDCVLELVKIKNGEAMPEKTAETKPAAATETKSAETKPEPITKAQAVESIAKYLGAEVWDAKMAIDALGTICALLSLEQNEGHPEAAEQTKQLVTAIQAIKAFIASEIMESDEPAAPAGEPVAEAVEAAAEITDLAKSFKSMTKAAKAMLGDHEKKMTEAIKSVRKAHSEFSKLGWKDEPKDGEAEGDDGDEDTDTDKDACNNGKTAAAKTDDLAKRMDEMTKRAEDAEKAASEAGAALKKMLDERDALAARLATKGSVRAVEKVDDVGEKKTESEAPKDTLGLIKMAHTKPINGRW